MIPAASRLSTAALLHASPVGGVSALASVASRLPSWTPTDTLNRVPRRHMGIMDTLKGFAGQAVDKAQKGVTDAKKAEIFKWQMDFMTTSPTYTLGDHLKLLELIADKSGANGWRKMLLTDAQKSSLEEQLVDLKLIDILTPAEKNDVRLLDGAARARLATQLGVTVQRVNQFLDGFKQSVNVHKWLATRKSQGKALPQTMEEYVNCMMADRVGMNKEAMKRAQSKYKHTKSQLRRM